MRILTVFAVGVLLVTGCVAEGGDQGDDVNQALLDEAPTGPLPTYLLGCDYDYSEMGYRTISYCSAAMGGGLQRARHKCNGSLKYGSWTAAGSMSQTPQCFGTITNPGQEFTN